MPHSGNSENIVEGETVISKVRNSGRTSFVLQHTSPTFYQDLCRKVTTKDSCKCSSCECTLHACLPHKCICLWMHLTFRLQGVQQSSKQGYILPKGILSSEDFKKALICNQNLYCPQKVGYIIYIRSSGGDMGARRIIGAKISWLWRATLPRPSCDCSTTTLSTSLSTRRSCRPTRRWRSSTAWARDTSSPPSSSLAYRQTSSPLLWWGEWAKVTGLYIKSEKSLWWHSILSCECDEV